jgi:hypothetical protein
VYAFESGVAASLATALHDASALAKTFSVPDTPSCSFLKMKIVAVTLQILFEAWPKPYTNLGRTIRAK